MVATHWSTVFHFGLPCCKLQICFSFYPYVTFLWTRHLRKIFKMVQRVESRLNWSQVKGLMFELFLLMQYFKNACKDFDFIHLAETSDWTFVNLCAFIFTKPNFLYSHLSLCGLSLCLRLIHFLPLRHLFSYCLRVLWRMRMFFLISLVELMLQFRVSSPPWSVFHTIKQSNKKDLKARFWIRLNSLVCH